MKFRKFVSFFLSMLILFLSVDLGLVGREIAAFAEEILEEQDEIADDMYAFGYGTANCTTCSVENCEDQMFEFESVEVLEELVLCTETPEPPETVEVCTEPPEPKNAPVTSTYATSVSVPATKPVTASNTTSISATIPITVSTERVESTTADGRTTTVSSGNYGYTLKYENKDESGGISYETFSNDDTIEKIIKNGSSNNYKPKLAHILSVFATSAYDKTTDIEYNYKQEGYKNVIPYRCELGIEYGYPDNVGCVIGSKKLKGENCYEFLITVRGTAGPVWTMLANSEWLSDFNTGGICSGDSRGYHKGFGIAYDMVLADWRDYRKKVCGDVIDIENCRFIITGHSRGAAVGNLVAHYFNTIGNRNNVYAYNFACPDSIYMDYNTQNDPVNIQLNANIFNISNSEDPVSLVPGLNGDAISNYSIFNLGNSFSVNPKLWGKYGNSAWFSYDWSEYTTGMTLWGAPKHDPRLYIAAMRKECSLNDPFYKPRMTMLRIGQENQKRKNKEAVNAVPGIISKLPCRIYQISCPVDVKIMDKSGVLLAEVVDNTTTYTEEGFGRILVIVVDDKKYIKVEEEGLDIDFEITAYDDGTMSIVCAESIGDITEEAVGFKDIPLKVGDKFSINKSDENINDTVVVCDNGVEYDPTDSFKLGDMNKDGSTSVADLVMLSNYVMGKTVNVPNLMAGDVFYDEEVDAFDMVMLRKIVIENNR